MSCFNKTAIAAGLDAYIFDKFIDVHLYASDLHDYQNDAEQFIYDNPFSALFIDTGLGKTAIGLKLIYRLVTLFEADRTLVIAPARVANVTWPDEIGQWEFSAPLTHAIIRDEDLIEEVNKAGQKARKEAKLEGHGKQVIEAMVKEARQKAGAKAVRDHMKRNPATIHLIHKEQVEFLVEAWGRDWPYDTVLIDESSSLKDHTTNRWKSLWRVRPLIKRMHQFTATPAAESYLHLFAQINLLDKGQRFGLSFNKFKERFFVENKYNRTVKLREGAEDEITRLISDICLVMKQEDYLDLQQPVHSYHNVTLDPEQMALYETMEREFVIELDDGSEIEAETAAALSQKLLQMASGVIYETRLEPKDDGTFKRTRVVHHLHDHKIDALAQLKEELNGENMLVCYYHQSSLERIMRAFPDARPMDKAGKLIKEWNAGKIPMLLLHPQSDAHGLNLQKGGRHVVFFDHPWSYENYYQFYRRLARQGQKLLVVIHHLIAKGTIDEVVDDCLRNKRDAQEHLFNLIKRLRAKLKRTMRPVTPVDDEL